MPIGHSGHSFMITYVMNARWAFITLLHRELASLRLVKINQIKIDPIILIASEAARAAEQPRGHDKLIGKYKREAWDPVQTSCLQLVWT